ILVRGFTGHSCPVSVQPNWTLPPCRLATGKSPEPADRNFCATPTPVQGFKARNFFSRKSLPNGETEATQGLLVNDQLASAQFDERVLVQQMEERFLMPREEFQQLIVVNVARGDEQELGRALVEFVRNCEI